MASTLYTTRAVSKSCGKYNTFRPLGVWTKLRGIVHDFGKDGIGFQRARALLITEYKGDIRFDFG
jgi:hypothetical protein